MTQPAITDLYLRDLPTGRCAVFAELDRLIASERISEPVAPLEAIPEADAHVDFCPRCSGPIEGRGQHCRECAKEISRERARERLRRLRAGERLAKFRPLRPASKITAEIATEIRRYCQDHSMIEAAGQFGISRMQVWNVVRGKCWRSQ